MGKLKDKEIENKNLPWWLRLLSPLFEWMEKRRMRKLSNGLLWIGGFDSLVVKQHLKSLTDDEARTHCGTCGGRLDDERQR